MGVLIKKKKKKEKTKKSIKSNLTPVTGYEYTPSLVKGGNRFATNVSIVNKFGMNRGKQYGWFVDMIPQISVPSVRAYLFMSSKPMTKKEQKLIFNKKVNETIKTLDNANAPKGETDGEQELRALHSYDLAKYSKQDARQQLAIDFQLQLQLVSDNPDDIAEQLRILKKNYNSDSLSGIDLTSVAGNQKNLFNRILNPPEKSVYNFSTMSSDFAGFDHTIRKGLDDENGVSIGELTVSLTNGHALMDLNKSFQKKILVASSSDSNIYKYDKKLSASSLWGQKISNHAMTNGHRTHHIVLNNFKYYIDAPEDGTIPRYSSHPIVNTALEHIDLSEGGLNPLEMYGNPKYASEIFTNTKNKIAQEFYYMTNRELSKDSTMELVDKLNDFYYAQKLWDAKVKQKPELARALNIKNHETMSTLGDFISWLKENLNRTRGRKSNSTEKEINDAKALYLTLKDSLDTYPHLFNTTTNLPIPNNPEKYQYYYELSGLRGAPNILEAQFLNTFDYITNFTEEGDIVMIHGVDNLTTETLELIKRRIEVLQDAGVRMAYLFDNISTGNPIKVKNNEDVYYSDMFNTKDILFKNFESQFDYTILGTMTKDDFEKYQDLINQKLPLDLAEVITASDQPYQFQIRRPSDLTSNYILADFII